MNRKSLTIIVFLVLALISSLYLTLRTTIFFGKATGSSSNSLVLENSYLFASPLQAKADGKEQIRITVFLLDSRGLGVPGQSVSLILPQTITVQTPQDTTDDTGKIIFDLSSPVASQLDIQAKTGNNTLPQKVHLIFY